MLIFFSRPTPEAGGKQTYWVRQKWGTSTLSFSQEVKPLAGDYTLTADLWKSGTGGNGLIFVKVGDEARREASPTDNMEAWQTTSLDFHCDGSQVVTIGFYALHNSAGNEKILGFDNLTMKSVSTGVTSLPVMQSGLKDVYSIDGKLLKKNVPVSESTNDLPAGIYIVGQEKVLVK